MREDLKGRNLSFTEIAKLVGENWQALSPNEKDPFEAQAFAAKEKYNSEMTEYKKTEGYKNYAEYLVDFKEKHPSQQQGILLKVDVVCHLYLRCDADFFVSKRGSKTTKNRQ